MRPYRLGCPQWQHPNWNDRLPDGSSALARYSRVFNCVEGNTTFYATPSRAQCEQWRAQVPDDFRFQFKFPRAVTHERLLHGASTLVAEFLDVMAPLRDVMGPCLLQLPAAFGPEHLDALWTFLEELPESLCCAVEVRHLAFFSKGEAERQLNQGLRARNTARVCFDSRPLFSVAAQDAITADAQRKKPRVPVHVLPVEADPVIRFIGHPDLQANRAFLSPWVARVSGWMAAGRRPYMFIHMPDNGDALALADLWHGMLQDVMPDLAPLPLGRQVDQPGLF